ncbi:helix-turn-helix domain-containing protein [Paenibacillus sp. FSL M7-0802]|uniref:helix-turn-helix transcriptional regulator n=1 Tax=Paenibacillus sp. FSL M7-0802 TaxID=2921536 RepID=UPI0030FCFC53
MNIKPRLNELLKQHGYTSQLQFCKQHGLSQHSINKFDKNKAFHIKTLFMISRALGVSIEELFIVDEIYEEN